MLKLQEPALLNQESCRVLCQFAFCPLDNWQTRRGYSLGCLLFLHRYIQMNEFWLLELHFAAGVQRTPAHHRHYYILFQRSRLPAFHKERFQHPVRNCGAGACCSQNAIDVGVV